MLKFLSKVRIEFNALDPRITPCMEFLAQCHAQRAKEPNPGCQIQVMRRTDDFPPQISLTFVNGTEETFDATSTAADHISNFISEKAQILETEHKFREAGQKWPVDIPEEELEQPFTGIKKSINPQRPRQSSGFSIGMSIRRFADSSRQRPQTASSSQGKREAKF